jgi:beta-glucuronidase
MFKKKKNKKRLSIHNEGYHAGFDLRNLNHNTMIFIGGRKVETLNGLWHYVVDQYDEGLRNNWYLLSGKKEKGEQLPRDYHTDEGALTSVPGCWNVMKPHYLYFEGSVWYSRKFGMKHLQKGERIFLRIGAAHYETMIFLNTAFLGSHCGGSTPFFVELTDHLKQENVLTIRVNNTRNRDRVPALSTDWFNRGGLYRDIELIRVPSVYIKDFTLYLVPDNLFSHIAFTVVVSDNTVRDTVSLTIPELGINGKFSLKDGICSETIRAHPILWSPDNPKLYDIEVTLGDDRICDRVGFRQITVNEREILLNGKPVFLCGISVHEDDVRLGKSSNAHDIMRRYRHAKALGCNFIRLAHYPHHELAARMADEAGLLLWEEIPVYWAINFKNQATCNDAENQLLELIKRDFNRASVIIWSLGNENADTDERLKFMRKLIKKAKSCDPSRPVSAACCANHEKPIIQDRLAEHLDIIGLNEYYGWYNQGFETLEALLLNTHPDKPVIITEFGAGAMAGYHDDASAMFSEEYMEYVYKRQTEILENIDYIKGMSPWILYDFASPRRQNQYQRGYNRKGLIAEDKKTKKKAFFILRQFYKKKMSE